MRVVPIESLTNDSLKKSDSKAKAWFNKYMMEGQHLDEEATEKLEKLPENPTLHDLLFVKYRKYTAMLVPFCLIQIVWWSSAIRHNFFEWYPTYWHMPLTMILGSFVAGITSEGSGAVAFPVMTLALHLNPQVARDFSIMIQSVGSTAACICVLFMKVRVEHRAIILGTIGCIPGFIIGVHFIDPLFTAPEKKMLFVSIWTAFAAALAYLNASKRSTYQQIPEFNLWKVVVLLITGFVGGVFDSFAGSGIDICIFSIITLLFRVSEKTATPTTVALKGINAIFGFYYRGVMMGDIEATAIRYFICSIPVAALMAPLGSLIGSHLHRQVVASFVYVLELAALIGFLFTRPTWILISIGAAIILGGFVFFHFVSKAGERLMDRIEEKRSLPQNIK